MEVTCTNGAAHIVRGLQWTDWDGATWEVVRPVGRIQGHGFGGTPTFACLHVSGPRLYADLQEADGTVVMCGDAIAAAVPAGHVPAWLAMADAPRDGTHIWLHVRHAMYRCAKPEQRHMWLQICPAQWTTFNRGGWTWHGLSGTPIGWRPRATR